MSIDAFFFREVENACFLPVAAVLESYNSQESLLPKLALVVLGIATTPIAMIGLIFSAIVSDAPPLPEAALRSPLVEGRLSDQFKKLKELINQNAPLTEVVYQFNQTKAKINTLFGVSMLAFCFETAQSPSASLKDRDPYQPIASALLEEIAEGTPYFQDLAEQVRLIKRVKNAPGFCTRQLNALEEAGNFEKIERVVEWISSAQVPRTSRMQVMYYPDAPIGSRYAILSL